MDKAYKTLFIYESYAQIKEGIESIIDLEDLTEEELNELMHILSQSASSYIFEREMIKKHESENDHH